MASGSGWSRALGRSRESWASRTSRSEKIMPSEGIGSWCFAPSHFAGGHTPTPSRRGTRGHSRTLSHRTSRTYPRRQRGGGKSPTMTTKRSRRFLRHGRWLYGEYEDGWTRGQCCGAIGGRGRRRPRHHNCERCLRLSSEDTRSIYMYLFNKLPSREAPIYPLERAS